MKKSLALLSVLALGLCFAFPAFGQIPNAGFESWTTGNGNPDNWWSNNIPGIWITVTQSHTAHSGTSSVRGDVINVSGSPLSTVLGAGTSMAGFPWTVRSATLTGWYQFSPAGGDRILVSGSLMKGGSGGNVSAIGFLYLPNAASSWTQFSLPFTYITSDVPDWALISISIVEPSGSNTVVHAGSYYLLDDLAFAGTVATAVNSGENSTPSAFELQQNYPNPFNPSTKINFSVAQAGHVTLKVYNVLGTEVASLVNEQKNAGTFSVNWNAAGLPSGMYLYRLSVTSEKGQLFDQAKRLVLLK